MANLEDGKTAAAWSCLVRCVFDLDLCATLVSLSVPFDPKDLGEWSYLIESGWFAICSEEIRRVAFDLIDRGLVEIEEVS